MKKNMIIKYIIILSIIILFNIVLFSIQPDTNIGYVGYIIPKVQKQYEDYFKYKSANKDKSQGEIYVNYGKLSPVEMMAVDVIVDKKLLDKSATYDYIKVYFKAANINDNSQVLSEYSNKVYNEMNSIANKHKYKSYLTFYKIIPYILDTVLFFLIIVALDKFQNRK